MFYLDTCIHFHKVEVAVLVYQEFYSTSTLIFDGFSCFYSCFSHFGTKFIGHKGRRSLLSEFLVTALYRAISFGKVASFSILVTYDLDFDMARLFYEFFHIHTIITESCCSLLSSALESLLEVFFFPYSTHSFSSTSGSGFEHYRIAHFLSYFLSFSNVLQQPVGARNGRYSSGFHGSFGCSLVSHFVNHFCRSPNEFDSILSAYFRKLSVF